MKNALAIGDAGEHLVVAELLIAGHRAFLTTQACPYDVAVEVDGVLLRIQVKTTAEAKPLLQQAQRHVVGYVWMLRRGKGHRRVYALDEFDAIALVALDSRQIAWLLPQDYKQTIIIPVSGHLRGRKFSDYPLDRIVSGVAP